MKSNPPFSLGATSYVVEDDLIANARYLAGKVTDMELVLFDLPDGTSNLPTREERQTLTRIGEESQLTYCVHLPVDLALIPIGNPSIAKAQKVMESVAGLPLSAVVAHLDDWYWRWQSLHGMDPFLYSQWQHQVLNVLAQVRQWIPINVPLCVENLESFPPEVIPPMARQAGCALCIDIGHLWKFGFPQPMQYLARHLPQTKVIHLHAYANGVDHRSLHQIPANSLDALMILLHQTHFRGILTMEVFGNNDFTQSFQTITQALERISTTWQK